MKKETLRVYLAEANERYDELCKLMHAVEDQRDALLRTVSASKPERIAIERGPIIERFEQQLKDAHQTIVARDNTIALLRSEVASLKNMVDRPVNVTVNPPEDRAYSLFSRGRSH